MPLVILSRGFISRSQFSVLSSQLPAPSSQRHASAQPNSRSLQRQAKTPNTCHLIFNVCHLIFNVCHLILTLDIWYLVFVDGEQVLSMTGPLIRTMLISKYFTWIKTVDKIVAEHSWHVKFICLDGCGWCLGGWGSEGCDGDMSRGRHLVTLAHTRDTGTQGQCLRPGLTIGSVSRTPVWSNRQEIIISAAATLAPELEVSGGQQRAGAR